MIEPYLRENGSVDGHFLRKTLGVLKPQVLDIIDIPDGDFCLPAFIQENLSSLVGAMNARL